MQARRALTHLLLALFLLFSQQAAFSHAATHLGNVPGSQDQQLPHGKACDQCVQGAHLGAALLDACHAQGWIDTPGAHAATAPQTVYLPRPVPSFFSRAPPAFL
jgi:hypothetical protein